MGASCPTESMLFPKCFEVTMVASFPAVRMEEMVRAGARELRVVGEISPPGQGSIEDRAVCRALRLLITEVTCWKGRVGKTLRGVSWEIRPGRTGPQRHLVSRPEALTCSADVLVAVVCLKTDEGIKASDVKS